MSSHRTRNTSPPQKFKTTQWSLVKNACAKTNDPLAADALQKLCVSYWYPLYAWARRSGFSLEDAQDLIQSFFAQLLEKNFLEKADPCKGKLRSFLLTCLKRHASDLRDKERAAKRDFRKTVSLDFEWAEGRYNEHQSSAESADILYDKRWVNTLLQFAIQLLEQEMNDRNKGEDFQHFKPYLGFTAEDGSYQVLADKLGVSNSAIKSRVFHLRKRYREILLQQISLTLAPEDDPKAELLELVTLV